MRTLLLPEHINRDIPGLEGRYYVTTNGNVFSHKKTWLAGRKESALCGREQTELSKRLSKSGYLFVQLYVHKKPKMVKIHRLVATTFIRNPENKPQVNHKDGDKKNNNYTNLEWSTGSENIQHSFDIGRIPVRGENHSESKLKEYQVLDILSSELPSTILSVKYKCSSSLIRSLRQGRRWKHINSNI